MSTVAQSSATPDLTTPTQQEFTQFRFVCLSESRLNELLLSRNDENESIHGSTASTIPCAAEEWAPLERQMPYRRQRGKLKKWYGWLLNRTAHLRFWSKK